MAYNETIKNMMVLVKMLKKMCAYVIMALMILLVRNSVLHQQYTGQESTTHASHSIHQCSIA
jgi:hypothetical protein